jgi:hypothetical protein
LGEEGLTLVIPSPGGGALDEFIFVLIEDASQTFVNRLKLLRVKVQNPASSEIIDFLEQIPSCNVEFLLVSLCLEDFAFKLVAQMHAILHSPLEGMNMLGENLIAPKTRYQLVQEGIKRSLILLKQANERSDLRLVAAAELGRLAHLGGNRDTIFFAIAKNA